MRIALGSIFRDSTPYLDRYFAQCRALRTALPADDVSFHWVEGDSVDDTYAALVDERAPADVVARCAHGGPTYGSVDNVARWRQISTVWNFVLDTACGNHYDAFICVESDLVWDAATMLHLLDDVQHVTAVSPLCMHRAGFFYDIYAFRSLDGRRFEATAPYHPDLKGDLLQVGSTGSCIVLRGAVAERVRFGTDTCLLGASIYANGYELYVDPRVCVVHP